MEIQNFGKWLIGMTSVLLVLPAGLADSRTPWFGGEPHTEVVSLQLPSTIKVSILRSRYPVAIRCSGPYTWTHTKSGKSTSLVAKNTLKIKIGKHGLVIDSKSQGVPIIVASAESGDTLTLNGRRYRGSFIVKPVGKSIEVIEQISLEDYLNGVLPREVGADWPNESLKAQAVISRTYVVANMGKGKGFDVTNNVFSQVYGGLQDENPSTNQAVADTRGEILVNDTGAAIQSFFHSSCGGRTESPEYVWQEVKDGSSDLEGITDPFCKDDPFFNWELDLKSDVLQKRLRRAGYRVGTLKKISVTKKSPSDRARTITVESSSGRLAIPGNSFRLALGPETLRSTLITTLEQNGKTFHFEGHGWGHGVGLCQWGARGRALAGQSYVKILDAYYPKARLVKATIPDHAR